MIAREPLTSHSIAPSTHLRAFFRQDHRASRVDMDDRFGRREGGVGHREGLGASGSWGSVNESCVMRESALGDYVGRASSHRSVWQRLTILRMR